jgi:hypothetical protein
LASPVGHACAHRVQQGRAHATHHDADCTRFTPSTQMMLGPLGMPGPRGDPLAHQLGLPGRCHVTSHIVLHGLMVASTPLRSLHSQHGAAMPASLQCSTAPYICHPLRCIRCWITPVGAAKHCCISVPPDRVRATRTYHVGKHADVDGHSTDIIAQRLDATRTDADRPAQTSSMWASG